MKNNFAFGAILSVLVSCFGLAFIYVFKALPLNQSVSEFTHNLKEYGGFRSATFSLAILGNIPLLYYFQRRRMMYSAYGVVAILVVIAAVIILSKLNKI